MPKSGLNVALKGLDDIFSTEESRQEEQREQVQQIPVSELFPFKNHPFKVLDDDSMTRTVESISQFGVLAPLIARPRPEGGYEIISGHRRKHAAELANLDTVPVIVRNMEDDAATILMVDSNLQREHILPSERAFAYKMKLDAIKNQGARSDLTSSQVGTKLRADEKVAKDSGESRNQVQRFVRLTNLVPELLDMVDEKKISFNPAVELSYLDEKQQQDFLEAMDASQNAPSLSQAIRIKKLAQQGEFDYDAVYNIMNEEKKSELDTVTITMNFTTTHIRSEKVTIDTRIYTILNGRKKPGEVYLAAIAPDMELTIITLDEAPGILPCFEEDDACLNLPNTSLLLCYNPAQVLKMGGKHYLTGPVILVRTNMDGEVISLTIDEVYLFQKYLASHSITLMADDQKLPCICME